MHYQVKSGTVLVRIDRALILDISNGDEITIDGLDVDSYKWREQDSQFVESNPDADIFLRLEKNREGSYRPRCIEVRPEPSPKD